MCNTVHCLPMTADTKHLCGYHSGPCPQVRMYQFSPTPKHIECVVFESVGGRDNNQGLGIKVRSELRCACLAAVSLSACVVGQIGRGCACGAHFLANQVSARHKHAVATGCGAAVFQVTAAQ